MNNWCGILFLLWISVFTLCEETLAMMQNEERDWRSSAKINLPILPNDENDIQNTEKWFFEAFKYINTTNLTRIEKKYQGAKFQNFARRNIASGRFLIFYEYQNTTDTPTIRYAEWFPRKIFVSGMAKLDENDNEVKNRQELKENLINARNLQPDQTEYENIEKTQNNALITLLGENFRTSAATHAEPSLILYIQQIPSLLKAIAEHENNKPVKIIGTMFQLITLLDPCDEHCIKMLNKFPEKIRENLENICKRDKIDTIKINDKLENLVLIAGVKQHEQSRKDMNPKNIPITLDFKNPSNKVISVTIENAVKDFLEKK